jgi:hypothetical protein
MKKQIQKGLSLHLAPIFIKFFEVQTGHAALHLCRKRGYQI